MNSTDPSSFEVAKQYQNGGKAMNEEINLIVMNEIWELFSSYLKLNALV